MHRLTNRGLTIFITGLPGAGKSTLAENLHGIFVSDFSRTVTVLDGDAIRRSLSSELQFSKEHRELNVLRTGFVAGEITRHGGIAICALIAPYAEPRNKVRKQISELGGFFEVYLATPLAVCEQRDKKGNYAKARAGEMQNFTGISDPYEAPENLELRLDMSDLPPRKAAEDVIEYLLQHGNLAKADPRKKSLP